MSEAAPELHASRTSSPSSSRAYDGRDLVSVLEERLALLVERHRDALKTIEELQTQLQDRQAQLGELSKRLESRDAIRDEVQRRVGSLIDRLAQVEAALSAHSAGSGSDGG